LKSEEYKPMVEKVDREVTVKIPLINIIQVLDGKTNMTFTMIWNLVPIKI